MLDVASQNVGKNSELTKNEKILEALEDGPMTIAELVRSTGIPDSTLYDPRHVPALVKIGKIEWDGHRVRLMKPLDIEARVRRFIETRSNGVFKPSKNDVAEELRLPPKDIEPAYYKAIKDWRPTKDDRKWVS